MTRIKIHRAESCDVIIVYIKSRPYYIYMTVKNLTTLFLVLGKSLGLGKRWLLAVG